MTPFIADGQEAFIAIPAPAGWTGDTIPYSGIKADGGFTAGVATLVNVGSLFEGLFGSGHAGSCGAFRDAYSDFFIQMGAFTANFNQVASQFVQQNTVNGLQPPQFVSDVLNAAVALDAAVDNGFNFHRGSNLVGQTMFHDRANGLIFRELVAPLIFFTNDYLWKWTRDAFFERDQNRFVAQQNALCCAQNTAAINSLFSPQGTLAQINDTLQQNSSRLNNLDFFIIPTLINDLANLNSFVRDPLLPSSQTLSGQVADLLNNVVPNLAGQIAFESGRVTGLEQAIADLEPTEGLIAQLQADLQNAINQSVLDDNALRQFLLNQIQAEASSREAALAELTSSLEAEAVRLQGEIDQARADFQAADVTLSNQLQEQLDQLDEQLNQRIGALEQEVQQLGSILQQQIDDGLDTLELELTDLIFTREAFILDQTQQLVDDLQQQLNDGLLSASDALAQVDAAIRADLTQFTTDSIATAQAQNALARQQLLDQLTLDLAGLQSQIDGNRLRLDQADLDREALRLEIDQRITELREQNIAELRDQLTTRINGLENTLLAAQEQLRDGLDLTNNRIEQSIVPTITGLQAQVTQIFSQLAEGIIPSITRNAIDIAFLSNLISGEIRDLIRNNDNNIRGLQDIITLDLDPRIHVNEACCSEHTTLLDQVFNVDLPDIRTTLLDIDINFIDRVVADCQRVRACIQDEWSQDREALCEWGRQAWGIMAECWLDANTPQPDEIVFAADMYDPVAAVAFIGSAPYPEENERGFRILADITQYLATIQEFDPPQRTALFEIGHNSQFVFEQVEA